jgi:hypothetical protein
MQARIVSTNNPSKKNLGCLLVLKCYLVLDINSSGSYSDYENKNGKKFNLEYLRPLHNLQRSLYISVCGHDYDDVHK